MAYWLLKSEPDCYSIDDLAAKGGPDVWDGCRNYTVRNFFRDAMSVGDLGFFYHSSCEPPGVVGIVRIASEAFPDPTQFDPTSEGYDPKSPPDAPRWITRDVELVEKFPKMVTIGQLRAEPSLAGMMLLQRGQRLSVMPVTEVEWETVLRLARAD